jgi:hypothetical protein
VPFRRDLLIVTLPGRHQPRVEAVRRAVGDPGAERQMELWEEFEGRPRRAPRFAFEFSLQYRRRGETAWHAGRGRNISRSGLLFESDEPLLPLTPIEVWFLGPVALPVESAAAVVCIGRVVRQASLEHEAGVILAATIDNYRFERPR